MGRWLLVAALVAAPLFVQADVSDTTASGRTLNGHPFLPMATVGSPFVNTEYQANTVVGLSTAGVTGDLTTEQVFGDDVGLGTLGTGFAAQIGIIDLLALRLAVTGNLQSGANENSAYLFGASAGPDFRVGATAKVLRLDFLQLGIGVDVSRAVTWQISPSNLVDAVVENFQQTGQIQIPRSAVYQQTDSLSIVPGLAFAVSPTPVIGLQGSLALSVDSAQVQGGASTTENAFVGGLGLSANFQPVGVPVGVLAAVTRNFGTESNPANTAFELGFFPVALSHFSLGLEVYLNNVEFPEQVAQLEDGSTATFRTSVNTVAGQLIMLYAR